MHPRIHGVRLSVAYSIWARFPQCPLNRSNLYGGGPFGSERVVHCPESGSVRFSEVADVLQQ